MQSKTAKKRAEATVAALIEKADKAAAGEQKPRAGRAKVEKARAFSPAEVLKNAELAGREPVRNTVASASVSTLEQSKWILECGAVDSIHGKVSYGLAVIFSERQDTPEGVIYPAVRLLSKALGLGADTPSAVVKEILGGADAVPSGHAARTMQNLMAGARKWAVKAKRLMPSAARRPQSAKTATVRIDGPVPRFIEHVDKDTKESRRLPVESKETGDPLYDGTSCLLADALNAETTREWALNTIRVSLKGVSVDGLKAVIGLIQVMVKEAQEVAA